ncbi:FYVE, RhoGEF and PH domain-containing protein 6 [Elysia marginata]|uniref:FYVE, RhoGEF and PH domain-containing protein 6 n=1 Tax=Elysia marginata TaxID=1093978 RepID=A0AAV4H268_9GAST|nr:FYVE, RhoGEF and PH domain-containing protein 6 [Elysia marginata]
MKAVSSNEMTPVLAHRVPGTPLKPPVAAKPSRRPAPPPPPPKPQSFKLAVSPPVKKSPGYQGKEGSSGLENGRAKTAKAVASVEELPSDCGGDSSQPPPLPTSPPPVQRKAPLSPSSSSSLPASFRNQWPRAGRKNSSEQIKNSPSLPSVPFQPPPTSLSHAPENTNHSPQPPAKSLPVKPPKPAVPPKTAVRSKAPSPSVKPRIPAPTLSQSPSHISNAIHQGETAQTKPHVKPTEQENDQSKSKNESNEPEDTSKSSPCLPVSGTSHEPIQPHPSSDPSPEEPTPDLSAISSCDPVPSVPKLPEKNSHLLATCLDSRPQEPEEEAPTNPTPKKPPPPPLPKNPPRGGLPRKARSSLARKPPDRPAPPKLTPDSSADTNQSSEVTTTSATTDSQSQPADVATESTVAAASPEAGNEKCSTGEEITTADSSTDNTQQEIQVSRKQPTPPKPRPRRSLTIPPPKPPEEVKQPVSEPDSHHHKDTVARSARSDTVGYEESASVACETVTSCSDSSPANTDPDRSREPVPVKEDFFPQKYSPQPELELDYVEVYRGEDGERHLRGLSSAVGTECSDEKREVNCASLGTFASQESLSAKSLDAQEPEPTCGMLKEIEELLNKKLEGHGESFDDLNSSEAEVKENPNLHATDIDSVSEHSISLSSSPVRPPRPKHKASIALRKGSIDSLNLTPQNASRESLTSLGSDKKVAPPKPKRNSTPRVSRSYSDVSGLRSPVDENPKGEGFAEKFPLPQSNGKPYLPPRSESLRKNESSLLSDSESPPPLPPRNRSRTALEASSSSLHTEPPPLPERVSLIAPERTDHRNPEEMKSHRNSGPPRLTTLPNDDDSVATSPHRSPVLRPARKAPAPPPTAPRRSATFGPGDVRSLTAFESSENIDRVTTSTSSEEPDYHEIPAEGLKGRRSQSPAPRLPPRVTRSKSLCSKEGPPGEASSSDSTNARGKGRKGSAVERSNSTKSKSKKEEQQAREKKSKTALIHRVTQGLGLKKTFRKSKSPESSSSKTSDSSSELEAEGLSDNTANGRTSTHSSKEDSAQGDVFTQGSDSVKIATEPSGGYENQSHIGEPITVRVTTVEGEHIEGKESELPSPAMERLGMEDLESEVMSALNSGRIGQTGGSFGQGVSSSNEARPASYRSTSTSSEREAGEEEEGEEAMSSASDSEPEPEEDKEEIYAIRKAKKVFFIAKEIMSSESVFVDVLKLLNVDFRVHVSEATEKLGQPVIPTSIMNKILAYLPQLQDFNEDLLRDLTERIKNWEDNPRLADIFVKKGPFLKLYSSYIRNFEASTATLDEATKKHAQFAAALKEFELSPRCACLALKHYMLKPIQRIPQYKLLLQDYLKQLNPASVDFKDTLTALNIVSEVADHANESMRHGDNVQKLLEIQRSLVGSFEVIQPGRELIMQGELEKVSRKEMQPRMFFLFSDVLLYTTPVTTGNKINNILPLIGMKVISPKLEDHENEFNIISVQRSFTLCASTPALKQQWVNSLQKAIEENAKRHNTFESVKQGPQTSLLDKDFVLGDKAPLWVPDARVTMCMLCLVEFTLTWRRHHCRSCGRIICAQCSQNKAPLRYLKYKPSRVCDECFDKLKEVLTKEVANEKNKRGKKKPSITADEESNTSITDDGPSSSFVRDDTDGDGGADHGDKARDVTGTTHHESGLSLHSLLDRFTKIRSSNTGKRTSGSSIPSVLKEVHANDEGSDMSGYLHTFKSRKWKKMWFVVKGNVLYTYKASADMAAVESMPLLGYEVSEFESVFEGTEPNLLIELRHKNNQPLTSRASKSLTGAERALQRTVLKTENVAATSKWLTVLRQAAQT